MIQLQDSSLEKLKCSKCEGYLSCSPVMVKLNGQNICGRCSLQDDDGKDIHAIRNKVYEEIASVVNFPCRYNKKGCTEILQWNKVLSHEERCDYRTYDCPVIPVGTCNWSGTNAQLLDHYEEEHPHLLLDHPCKIAPDLNRDGEENFLLTCFGFLFLVQIKLNSTLGKLWTCVRYLGNPSYLSNFEFSLEVRNIQDIMKKYKKVSPRENLMMNRANCIEVNVKTLIDFLGGSQNISFNVWVKKKGSICFKCKKEIKPLKLYYLGEGFHCENCREDIFEARGYSQQFPIMRN